MGDVVSDFRCRWGYGAEVVCGMWDMKIWDVGYGIWDMGYGIWGYGDMGYGIWGIWDMGGMGDMDVRMMLCRM